MAHVSVIMTTYAHEKFIYEAILGVLSQQCTFNVELIIADDHSPDKTADIVRSFSNHPNYGWIKYTRHNENKGMALNFNWALEKSTGKYIASCEGDDYWLDPFKLQKQVTFLESNPDYSACFHKVKFKHIDEELDSMSNRNLDSDKDFNFSDFISENPASTCSVLYRSHILKSNNRYLKFQPVIDDFVILLFAKAGKIRYMNEVMGVYRIHPGGIASMREELTGIKLMIQYRKAILNYFKAENEMLISEFYKVVGNLYKRMALAHLKKDRYFKFYSCYLYAAYYIYKGGGKIYYEIISSAKSHLIQK